MTAQSSETNVVGLRGAKPALPGEPNAEVLAVLRDVLARAERGEVAAVGVALVAPSGRIASTYQEGEAQMAFLVAASANLQARLLEDWRAGAEYMPEEIPESGA